MHSDRHRRARAACQPVPRSEAAVKVSKPTCSSAQAPDLPQTVARPLGSVRLLTSSRSAPGAEIKVARRTAFHVLRHDADRTVCMAVELATSWVSDACHLDGLIGAPGQPDGKGAWCQVRPARRRVHGWATPTRRGVVDQNGAFQPLS
jgi:hypothetical protein